MPPPAVPIGQSAVPSVPNLPGDQPELTPVTPTMPATPAMSTGPTGPTGPQGPTGPEPSLLDYERQEEIIKKELVAIPMGSTSPCSIIFDTTGIREGITLGTVEKSICVNRKTIESQSPSHREQRTRLPSLRFKKSPFPTVTVPPVLLSTRSII